MALSPKNKRKIIFNEQLFYWWVKDDFDYNGAMLAINIATEDKSFLVKYYTVQRQSVNQFITVLGKTFPGLERKKGNWQRFICPDFVPEFTSHGIGPKDVASILTWCFDESKSLVEVNYKGELI